MVSKIIEVNSGEKVTYKVIKDGYKTVTEEINITGDMPVKNTYDLVPSTEEYVPNFEYDIDTSLSCAPIITFSEKPITPDGTEINKTKYILASQNKDYLVTKNNDLDSFVRVGDIKVNQNGIAFNFNSQNYLKTPTLNFETNDYEIVLEFTPLSWSSAYQCMFYSSNLCWFNIAITNSISGNYYIHSNTGDHSSTWNSSIIGITPLELNKTYLVKTTRISGIRYMYLSSDNGENWTLEGQHTDTDTYSIDYLIGTGPNSGNEYFGTVGLKNSYIKINNELVWKGTRSCLPVNTKVVGPMIIDNYVTKSTFSSSCYCDTYPKDFTRASNTANSWEWVFKIEKYIPSGAVQVLYSQGRSYESALHVSAANKPYVLLNNTGNSTYFGSLYSDTVLEEGKLYWLKLEFTGTEYKLLLSEDGITWNLEASLESSTKLAYGSADNWHIGWNYHGSSSYHYPLKCELNLAESYIIVDNQTWWQGKDIYLRNYLNGSTLYVNKEDLLTNFSSSNYLTTPSIVHIPTSYEAVIRYKTDSYNGGRLIGNHSTNKHSLQIQLNNTNELAIYHPSSSYAWISNKISYKFELNKWYWVKCTWNITDKKVITYIKTDDTNWEKIDEFEATSCGWDQNVEIGADQNASILSGNSFIDLRESYIKINDKYYWKPIEGPFGEYIPGILNSSIKDISEEKTYNLYDVQTDVRSLILSEDKNINVDNIKFIEYCGQVTIPSHTVYEYDTTNSIWSNLPVTINYNIPEGATITINENTVTSSPYITDEIGELVYKVNKEGYEEYTGQIDYAFGGSTYEITITEDDMISNSSSEGPSISPDTPSLTRQYYAFTPTNNAFLTSANTNGNINGDTSTFYATGEEVGTHQILYMLNPETGNMIEITNVELRITSSSLSVYPLTTGTQFFAPPKQTDAVRNSTKDIVANATPEASTTATITSNSTIV